jgi:hypothetical protein
MMVPVFHAAERQRSVAVGANRLAPTLFFTSPQTTRLNSDEPALAELVAFATSFSWWLPAHSPFLAAGFSRACDFGFSPRLRRVQRLKPALAR